MPPRKAATQSQSKESATTTTASKTRGRATTAAARATRSSPTKQKSSPAVTLPPPPRPAPLSKKTRGGASSPEKKGVDKKVEKDVVEKQILPPPSPTTINIKKSPTKTTTVDEALIKETATAKKKKILDDNKKQQSRRKVDDIVDTSDDDDDHDEEEKQETTRNKPLQSSTPTKKGPKSKVSSPSPHPPPTPQRTSSSKPSGDVSDDDEDEEDEHHHDPLDDYGGGEDEHDVMMMGDAAAGGSSTATTTKTKDEDLNEGMNVFASMDSKEIEELLDRIDKQCSPTDNYMVRKRENAIDWEQVAFSLHGAHQCRVAWLYLKHHTRSYRIMSEVVNEVKHKFTSDRSFQTKLIENLPNFPKKPPNSLGGFHCFNREQWEKKKKAAQESELDLPNYVKFQRECRAKFEALPNPIKEKYDQEAALAMAEYKRQVRQFYAENPALAQFISKQKSSSHAKTARVRTQKRQRNPSVSGTSRSHKSDWSDPYEDAPEMPVSPAVTFMQLKLNGIEPPPTQEQLTSLKQGIFEKWKSLSDRKRAKWIDNCINDCVIYIESSKQYQETHPGYDIPPPKMKQLLTVEEMGIWETANGKPKNHWQNSYDMFLEEFLKSDDNVGLSEDEGRAMAHTKWNEMQWFQKQMFTMRFKVSQLEYRNNLQNFYAKVPPFLKDICLKKIPKKYWKELEEVDKVPTTKSSKPSSSATSELLITAEEGVVYRDETHKKQKKSKKRKHENETDMKDEEDEDASEANQGRGGEDVQLTTHDAVEYLQQKEDQQDDEPIPKKKKKKKKQQHTEQDEIELNYRNYQHDDDEDVDNDYPLQGGKYSKAADKAKKIGKLHREEMMRAGDRAAVTLEQDFVQKHKSPSNYFPQNNIITKNDIYESIRGIFDGRGALGRKFSVYYYYSKYVASEKMWIDSVNATSLSKTATNIIRTFLSLSEVQQDIFIQQSYAYHEAKRHSQNFPNEPKPPLKLAKNLYSKQVTNMKKKDPTFVAPTWSELSESGQLYYTKKLYHETKLYMTQYDAFISSLTPSDFVDYAIHKYKNWEINLYTKQSISLAFRSFMFPMISAAEGVTLNDSTLLVKKEAEGMIRGVDGELNLIGTDLPCTSTRARNLYNPFKTNKAVDEMLKTCKKGSHTSHRTEEDSDDSDNKDDNIEFSLLFDKDDIFRRKLKKAEMYDYPLDDILLLLPNNQKPQSSSLDRRTRRIKWISIGTQTNITQDNLII